MGVFSPRDVGRHVASRRVSGDSSRCHFAAIRDRHNADLRAIL